MSHIELVVVEKPNSLTKQQRIRDIECNGGLVHFGRGRDVAAKQISCLPWVARVVATHVTEVHSGTWRQGRKS